MRDFCTRRPLTAYTLLFLCINVVSALLFLVYYPLTANLSEFAKVLYYFTQLFSAATTCIAVACVYTALKLRGWKKAIAYAVIAAAMLMIPSVLSTVLNYWGDILAITAGIIQAIVIFLQYTAIYLVFAILMWGIEDRRSAPFAAPRLFALKNPHSAGIWVATALLALLRIVPETIDVVTYIDDRAGIMFFEDWLDIIWVYAFILITVFLSYVCIVLVRRLLYSMFSQPSADSDLTR